MGGTGRAETPSLHLDQWPLHRYATGEVERPLTGLGVGPVFGITGVSLHGPKHPGDGCKGMLAVKQRGQDGAQRLLCPAVGQWTCAKGKASGP